jgi:hypothetical protein
MLPVTETKKPVYEIIDGDIPCTPEVEPSFGYTWNFCGNVPTAYIPGPCQKQGKSGVVLQWLQVKEEYNCLILGHYGQQQTDVHYDLYDPLDPSKGVSIRYPSGEQCSATVKKPRTAVIDIECANVPSIVVSAQEPEMCEYHLQMKSYYGCPTVCLLSLCGCWFSIVCCLSLDIFVIFFYPVCCFLLFFLIGMSSHLRRIM